MNYLCRLQWQDDQRDRDRPGKDDARPGALDEGREARRETAQACKQQLSHARADLESDAQMLFKHGCAPAYLAATAFDLARSFLRGREEQTTKQKGNMHNQQKKVLRRGYFQLFG